MIYWVYRCRRLLYFTIDEIIPKKTSLVRLRYILSQKKFRTGNGILS